MTLVFSVGRRLEPNLFLFYFLILLRREWNQSRFRSSFLRRKKIGAKYISLLFSDSFKKGMEPKPLFSAQVF